MSETAAGAIRMDEGGRMKDEIELIAGRRSLLHLFAVGLGLPALLVSSDQLLLSSVAATREDLWAAFFIWLVGQTAIVSFAVGKWLDNWLWRVIVLSWTLLLLNVVLFHATALAANSWQRGAFAPDLLAVAFVAAQVSLLAAWLYLGSARWQWRLPAAAIAVLPAGLVIAELDRRGLSAERVWKQVAALQIMSTLLFAAAMRCRGYRVERLDQGASLHSADGKQAASQFSLSQLLIWTTAISPAMVLLSALRYTFPRVLSWREWGLVAAEGMLLAPVGLAAFWAALGHGRIWPRVAGLVVIAATMAAALRYLEGLCGTPPPWLAGGGPGVYIWVGNSFSIAVTHAGLTWLVWTELSAFLLAGMLIVFRVNSYRLVRRSRSSSLPQVNP